MNKQEAIKQAYGEHWETVKDYVDENGWIENCSSIYINIYNKLKEIDIETRDGGELLFIRPKSLQGIEDNNGWFKTEDGIFPEDEIPVLWLNFENGEHELASLLHVDFKHTDYTHWTPINLKSPIH